MSKAWKWVKSLCKCTKRCKCFHCRFGVWAKKKLSNSSDWLWDKVPSEEALKGLGLITASLCLWFTGSLECTAGFLLLGWGLLELLECYRWK